MGLQHSFTSPLRYPGGKGQLANFVKLVIVQNGLSDGEYAEVYAGGAAIAWSLLFEEYVSRVHVNDLNKSLYAFWYSVLNDTEALCRLIQDTEVSMEEWQRQKNVQAHAADVTQLELAFSTFFLNRTNRSGILTGGVIGGKEQAGEWTLDARFNKPDLIARIQRIARYGERIAIYNLDAAQFIREVLPSLSPNTLVYFDPPYFNKGEELYENHYTPAEHETIARLITTGVVQPWVVSYDATEEIAELYRDYRRATYKVEYSAQSRYAGGELMFFSRGLEIPSIYDPSRVKRKHVKAYVEDRLAGQSLMGF